MANSEDSGSPGWSASSFTPTTEDVTKAVASAAVAATTIHLPHPSAVISSKDDHSYSQLQKLQRQVARVIKGFSPLPEVKRVTYNPEVLTSLKRQWASFQLQSLVWYSHSCCPFPFQATLICVVCIFSSVLFC